MTAGQVDHAGVAVEAPQVGVEEPEALAEPRGVEGRRAQAEAHQGLVAALRVGLGQVGGDRPLGDVQAAAAHEGLRGRLQLEGAPQPEGLVREARVGCVQIVVAKRARAAERRRHRIADPPALEHDDPPDPLRRVIRREQTHDAASDHEEVAVTVDALAGPDAHAVLARLRERTPLAWVPVLGGWLVLRRDLALHVMGDAGTFTVDDARFSTGRVVGPSMLTLDGGEHQRHRAPFARPFRLQPVRERFIDVVAHEVDRLIDAFEPAGAAELRRALRRPARRRDRDPRARTARGRRRRVLGWYDAIVAAGHRDHGRRRGAPRPAARPSRSSQRRDRARAGRGPRPRCSADAAGGLERPTRSSPTRR